MSTSVTHRPVLSLFPPRSCRPRLLIDLFFLYFLLDHVDLGYSSTCSFSIFSSIMSTSATHRPVLSLFSPRSCRPRLLIDLFFPFFLLDHVDLGYSSTCSFSIFSSIMSTSTFHRHVLSLFSPRSCRPRPSFGMFFLSILP